jgi:hypothetical protein
LDQLLKGRKRDKPAAHAAAVNTGLTMLYWNIGQRVRQEILKDGRAEYGEAIVSTLSRQLQVEYGRGFSAKNLRHMIRFAEVFADEGLSRRCGDTSGSYAYIVENLQTGLAFDELPGAVVFMGLGYGVDQLAHFKWLNEIRCIYWGDIDTHGFAILNRARSYLPHLKSLLMDEQTLLNHKTLWVEEKQQHSATVLPNLTDEEQSVYCGIKNNKWG